MTSKTEEVQHELLNYEDDDASPPPSYRQSILETLQSGAPRQFALVNWSGTVLDLRTMHVIEGGPGTSKNEVAIAYNVKFVSLAVIHVHRGEDTLGPLVGDIAIRAAHPIGMRISFAKTAQGDVSDDGAWSEHDFNLDELVKAANNRKKAGSTTAMHPSDSSSSQPENQEDQIDMVRLPLHLQYSGATTDLFWEAIPHVEKRGKLRSNKHKLDLRLVDNTGKEYATFVSSNPEVKQQTHHLPNGRTGDNWGVLKTNHSGDQLFTDQVVVSLLAVLELYSRATGGSHSTGAVLGNVASAAVSCCVM